MVHAKWSLGMHILAALIALIIGMEAIKIYGYIQDRHSDAMCRERGGYSVRTWGEWTCAQLELRT